MNRIARYGSRREGIMRDQWRQAGLLPSLLSSSRLNRRALVRTAGTVAVAGPVGVTARRLGAAAQDAGEAIIRSRPRAAVMQEILAAYPLRREGAPEGGSVIVGNLGDVQTVNPLLAGSNTEVELVSLVYEGLVGMHPIDGSIIPWLADYELAADEVTYTFRIHPDARFHDGAPVTAADAAFTLEMLLDPANVGLASSIEAVLKEHRVVDDKTFVMVSNGPIASFLHDTVLLILVMPKHVWASVAPEDRPADPGSTGEDPARVVGSGPFRFAGRVPGDHVTLARNDDYWNRELSRVPYLDELIFQAMPDSQTRALALDVGDVDVARVPPTDIGRFANGGGVAVVSFDALGFTCYACQLDPGKTPLFQDKAVRQALFIALDRQAIVDSLLEGLSTVARGTQPPLSPAYRPGEFEPYDYDPERARELLAQAGWTDADGDGVVEKEGQRFSFSMLVRADSATRVSIATYLQDAWKDVGVEMTLDLVDFGTVGDRMDAGDFEMVLYAQGLGVDPSQGWFFATGANFFGYSNPEFDRLEAEQRRTLDPAQRIELIVKQSKIVWDELPIGILTFDGQTVGHTERLRNIFPNTYGGIFWSAPFWYLEG
jgi:peptide/nickel transport system substrate-binding protein